MKKTLLATIIGVSVVFGALPAVASTTEANAGLLTELNRGSQGDLVKLLQAILASDSSVYPEGLVTGTFGPLTAKAVMRFQKKHGLEQVGRVGPRTLQALRGDFASTTLATEDEDDDTSMRGENRGKKLCIPPGHLIAPGWLKKNGGSPRMMGSTTGTTASTTIPFCKNPLPKGIKDKLENDWQNGSTTKDRTAPVISAVTVSNLASTSASVGWTTNEFSTGKVYFGTSTPLNLATATSVSSNTPVKTHSLSLTGLATSTLYYYVASSKDGSNNVATSTQSSFTTLAL